MAPQLHLDNSWRNSVEDLPGVLERFWDSANKICKENAEEYDVLFNASKRMLLLLYNTQDRDKIKLELNGELLPLFDKPWLLCGT